jgi:hypothetical protein
MRQFIRPGCKYSPDPYRSRWILLTVLCVLSVAGLHSQAPAPAAPEPSLTEEQMKDFLLNAKVIDSRHTSKGITSPFRLTLSDGKITHDALFQSIDDHKISQQLANGTTELNFADSYHYNVAAYELSTLLGMKDVIPVTVARKWNGKEGSLAWWINVKMDEITRTQKKIPAPNADAWNHQMYNIRVFDQLVYDTDANMTNFLITEDWQLRRVDFSRAFRLIKKLQSEKDLPMCGRDLFEKLKTLNVNDVTTKTKPQLNAGEIAAVMDRRDKLVAHFQQLIADKGESAILF